MSKKDQLPPDPRKYPTPESYEKAMLKHQGKLPKVNIMTMDLDENGEEIHRHYHYKPSYIDIWDGSPVRYKSINLSMKVLKCVSKQPTLQKRQIEKRLAQQAAKKVKAKHPEWPNSRIAKAPEVEKHFDEYMTDRHKLKILHEVFPGKPGRPRNS